MNTCRSKSTINPYFKRPKINNLNPQHITNKNSNSPRTFNFFRHISLHSATRSHSTPLGYDDTVLVAGVYRLSKLSEHWNGFNTKKQQQVATLSQIFFINLIVFFVCFFGQEPGLFQLVLEGVHAFLIGQWAVLENFALPSENLQCESWK